MTTIVCPTCKTTIDISEALEHAYESEFAEKNKLQLEEATRFAEEKAFKKASEEAELRIKDKENEAKEAREQARKQQQEILDLMKKMRELKEKDEVRALETEKKLNEEREKIKTEAQKQAEAALHTQILEKDKQLADITKELDDAKRKAQQGSQQAQGEVFELEFEQLLKQQYPHDKIMPVGKGIKGGDIVQEVWDSNGNYAGKIIWELKNTKTWSEPWIDKLKGDKRAINADEAVIISEILPTHIKNAGFHNGVWVTQRNFVLPLTDSLRVKLIQLIIIKNSLKGKDLKMEALYGYLTGTEFKNRIEAIVESFSSMQQEIEKEKRYFANKWARDEKNIRQVIDGTYGMHGDLKGILAAAIPQIQGLELLEDGGKSN